MAHGGSVDPFNFTSYEDAQIWMNQKSKEYKNQNEFYTSDEYKLAYPIILKLYEVEKSSYSKMAKAAMEESSVNYGDRVFYDYLTPFMDSEKYSGVVVERNGLPYVKFDEGQQTISGAKSTKWHKGWKKETFAKGGPVDAKGTGAFLNGKELTFQELIEQTKKEIKDLEQKESTEETNLRRYKLLESKYKRLKYYELKAKINELQEKQYIVRSSSEYDKLEKQINSLKKELRDKFAQGGPVDAKDTVTVDIPLMIRLLELSKEDIKSDAELHMVVERLLDLKNKPVLTMDDYSYIAEIEHKHLQKMALGGNLETEKLISQAHTNLTVKKGRRDYAPTSTEIQEEIDRMIMEEQFGSTNI